jgi:tetratricopeptide (TPR) repeat protein
MATKKPGFLESFTKGLGPKKPAKDKEIEKYEKMLEEHADDRNAINTLGDLYAKRGDAEKACEYYLRVGELYAKDGFTLKAIAVYKKAQRAKPDVIQTYIDLADLYVEKGLIGEAKSNYLTAAEMQASAGAKHESLDIYRKIADLDPNNLNIRTKLATMYEKENFLEDAATIYAEIGDVVIQQDVVEGKNYYNRAIELQPENEQIWSRIGYAYVDQNLLPDAVGIFKKLLEFNPRSLDYKEQLQELQGTSNAPEPVAEAPADLIVESAVITFSDDELSSLNLGEEAAAEPDEMGIITGLHEESAADDGGMLNFSVGEPAPKIDFGGTEVQSAGLDFQLDQQDMLNFDQAPGGAVEPELHFDLSSSDVPMSDAEAELALPVEPEARAQAAPAPSSGGGFFDLASQLETAVQIGREFDTVPAPAKQAPRARKAQTAPVKVEAHERLATSEISDIIKEFKQGVMEEVGTEDYETHYELGISYKEMSLLDEAIEELKLAALEPAKFVECQGVIGLCYIEKGDYDNAVKAFQLARGKVKKQSEEYQDLTYQLAVSYEEAGKVMEAARELQSLYQLKSDYRDVKQRLKRLMG